MLSLFAIHVNNTSAFSDLSRLNMIALRRIASNAARRVHGTTMDRVQAKEKSSIKDEHGTGKP